MSSKTKQLVSDLKTLRLVLAYLTQYDCITFYNFVSTLRTAESAMKSGGWVLLDSAETLFITAKKRVMDGLESNEKKDKTKDSSKETNLFEENPKWTEIGKVVAEIRDELKAEQQTVNDEAELEGDQEGGQEKILIVTRDERTARQVEEFLACGSQVVLGRLYNKTLGEKYGRLQQFPEPREVKHRGEGKRSGEREKEEEQSTPATLLHALDSCQQFDTARLLEETRPRFILLADTDLAFVRQVEAYQARHPAPQLRVYFLLYRASVEEQGYLTALRREKEAFERLIAAKAEMVVPEDREGRDGDNSLLERGLGKASDVIMEREKSSRRGGGQQENKVTAKVIVDMREFRSELPSLLHKRGIEIEPVTLEVGDYIITPDICLERKSIRHGAQILVTSWGW